MRHNLEGLLFIKITSNEKLTFSQGVYEIIDTNYYKFSVDYRKKQVILRRSEEKGYILNHFSMKMRIGGDLYRVVRELVPTGNPRIYGSYSYKENGIVFDCVRGVDNGV